MAVAMLGARRHYAVPKILHDAGMLDCFFTDIDVDSGWLRLAASLIPRPLRNDNVARLLERHATGIPRGKVRSFPWFGLHRAILSRHATSPSQRLRAYLDWNREFGRLVCRHWPASAETAYVFNGAGLEVLEHAAGPSAAGILDQTAAPWSVEETLLAEERERWTGWEFEGAAPEDWKPLAERERREWDLARVIVCGSDYVRDSIRAAGGPAEKCAIVPYGMDAGTARARSGEGRAGPLKVLFVGTIQLRKGIQYVMEAAHLLKGHNIVIRAVGGIRVSADAAKQIGDVIELKGSVPRSAVRSEYEWADVLLAPSISEGSANVCYEALAAGLPVITTPNAGSVVRDDVDGFLVPIRSAEAIAAKVRSLAADRKKLAELSRNAAERAHDFTRQKYGERLVAAITNHDHTH